MVHHCIRASAAPLGRCAPRGGVLATVARPAMRTASVSRSESEPNMYARPTTVTARPRTLRRVLARQLDRPPRPPNQPSNALVFSGGAEPRPLQHLVGQHPDGEHQRMLPVMRRSRSSGFAPAAVANSSKASSPENASSGHPLGYVAQSAARVLATSRSAILPSRPLIEAQHATRARSSSSLDAACSRYRLATSRASRASADRSKSGTRRSRIARSNRTRGLGLPAARLAPPTCPDSSCLSAQRPGVQR